MAELAWWTVNAISRDKPYRRLLKYINLKGVMPAKRSGKDVDLFIRRVCRFLKRANLPKGRGAKPQGLSIEWQPGRQMGFKKIQKKLMEGKK